MRRLAFLAAFMLVVASCGRPARQVETVEIRARSSSATSTVDSLRPMLQSAADEAAAEEGFLAALAASKPVPAVVPRPAQPVALAQPQAVSQPCSGWEAEVEAVFGAAAGQACRVLGCESGGDPQARNRSGATGLFQLLGHGDLFEAHGWTLADAVDGVRNIAVAHDLWLAEGWRPWVCRP